VAKEVLFIVQLSARSNATVLHLALTNEQPARVEVLDHLGDLRRGTPASGQISYRATRQTHHRMENNRETHRGGADAG
jgi:hypothetical protein